MINNIFRLSMGVILFQLNIRLLQIKAQDSRKDLEIWPNLSSLILTSDTLENKRALLCLGNEPIKWYYKQNDETLTIKKNSSIKVFSTAKNKITYLSLLLLSEVTFLDTGYYICSPTTELKYYKDIYVFVHHEAHLLAIPEDLKLLRDFTKYDTVIGPFRPTSPDVNIKIETDTKNVYETSCNPMNFRCSNDQCISRNSVCNEQKDCTDGSDEDEFMCKERTCDLENEFRCSNGLCLDNFWLCDGIKHCNDSGDENELMCKARSCPSTRPFKCNNGKCIHKVQVCDGQMHCNDGRDEDELMCKERTCDLDYFKCTSGQCLPDYWVCNIDDRKDCSDGIDEDELMCKARPCNSERPFKCTNGKCIYISQVCDGKKDCNDGNDEDELMCKVKKCNPESQFKCTNGQCIWNVQVCNGLKNCNDSSDEDELMCKAKTCDPGRSFKCKNGIQCISNSRVCDGMAVHCNDGSDEDELMCKVTRYMKFDDKKGFQMHASIFLELNILIFCTASKNNIIEHRLIPNPWESWLHINDSSSGHAIIGHNVTLKCTLEFRINFIYRLKWVLPDIPKNKIQNRPFKIEHYVNDTVSLYIQHVSNDDEGDYICTAMATNGQNYSKKYILRTFAYDVNYFNLRINDDVNKKIRPAGHDSVQWTIQISAIQNTSLKWIGPNGKKLETKSENTCMKSNNCSSELIITNLQLSDSGVYKLAAFNGVESKETKTTLLIEEKPRIIFIKSLSSNLSFYEIGKNYTFEFYVSGYPLPDIKWTFEKCSNYPQCEQSDTEIKEIKEIKNETIQVSEITLKLVIIMNITVTGTLICNASNILGNFSKQYTVLVIDTSPDLEVKGSSIIIPGDTVTIQCAASTYNYHNDITWNTWNHSKDNLTESNFNIIHSKTKLSYVSNLMIKNISKAFNGYIINCTLKRIIQPNNVQPDTETKSLAIKVEDPQIPVINNSSNTSISIVVYHGKRLNLNCFATGVPPPTISWFKDDRLLFYEENNTEVLMQNENTLLRVQMTEIDRNTIYKCNASNKIGSTILTYTLTLNDKRPENKRFGIFVSFAMSTVYLGILFKCYLMYFGKKKTMKKAQALIDMYKLENDAIKSFYPNFNAELQKYAQYKRLYFRADKLSLGKQLGSGAFGIVFKGKALDIIDENVTTTVAVKTVNSSCDQSCISALESELKMMIHIGSHLNIVNLLGMCTDVIDKKLMVIVEYCCFGSIHQYMLNHRNYFINQFTVDGFVKYDSESKPSNPIYENIPYDVTKSKHNEDTRIDIAGILVNDEAVPRKYTNNQGNNNKLKNIKPLCTYDLICWSFQVARGMEYLASKKVLHGDLATRNILLAKENVVKICDFGLSKSLCDKEIYKKKSKKDLLPIKWMAIESIRDLVFSTQSDVWSFGIVLWEMFSLASTPYPDLQFYELYDKLLDGYRLKQPKYANSQIYNIMLDCWEAEPSQRPLFTHLTDRFGCILQDSSKSNYVNLNEGHTKTVYETMPSTNSTFCVTVPPNSNCSIVADNNEKPNENIPTDCSLNIHEIIPKDNDE